MKWYSTKEKLPKKGEWVLICVKHKIDKFYYYTHDIGKITNEDRWCLDSQQYNRVLQLKPTVDSGIVTHWAKLPKLPEQEEKGGKDELC